MEFHFNKNIGTLEVITGSMFSGKSEELIRRLRRTKYAKQKIVVFKHSIDNRYGKEGIFSHGNDSLEAYPVSCVEEMEKIMVKNHDAEVIGIDEVQFFGEKVVDFCKKYVEMGKRVIVAGLDMSFRAEPYHPMPELMGISDKVDKLHAICMICGKPAYASQRLIDGEPAYYDDPLVLVGASENYEARCRRHHIVRYRENRKGKIYFLIGTDIGTGKKDAEKMYIDNLLNKKYKTLVIKANIKNYFNVEKGEILSENNDTEKNIKDLIQLRNDVEKALNENDVVFIRIIGSMLLSIEGNYSILDFMCEYRKDSEVIIVSKNKKGVLNQVLLNVDLLKNADLNLKKIIYTNGSEDKEDKEVIEKIKEITRLNYEIIG